MYTYCFLIDTSPPSVCIMHSTIHNNKKISCNQGSGQSCSLWDKNIHFSASPVTFNCPPKWMQNKLQIEIHHILLTQWQWTAEPNWPKDDIFNIYCASEMRKKKKKSQNWSMFSIMMFSAKIKRAKWCVLRISVFSEKIMEIYRILHHNKSA